MIQIFVDSGANLSAELREQYNIHLLPMALTINDQPAPCLLYTSPSPRDA